jgi:adenylate cyclase
MKEIEKKYLLKEFKPSPDYVKKGIKQWYITKPEDSVSNRLRLYDDGQCIFSIKKGISIAREEVEIEVNFEDYESLLRWRPYVSKTRYIIYEDDDCEIIVDEYHEQLDGLYVMEVEGKGEDSFNYIFNYELPDKYKDWVDKEVTNDVEYTNVALAEKNMIKPKNIDRLYKIINDIVKDDAIEEAKEIADNMSDKDASELEMYYDDDSPNIVCLHLDSVKYELIQNGILTKKDTDQFGDVPY